MLILLIQVQSLCFAQYPLTKKIGNDTVVIMTIKQGEEINKLFDKSKEDFIAINNSLKIARDSLLKFKIDTDSLIYEVKLLQLKSEDFKFKYEENKKIYLQNEKTYNKIHNNDVLQKVLFALVLGFVAFKLN